MTHILPYAPFHGKTYSLFGDSDHTRDYYSDSAIFAEECLGRAGDPVELLRIIRSYSNQRNRLRIISRLKPNSSIISYILHRAEFLLSGYTREVDDHLRQLSWNKIWDRRLGTIRQQYYLHMLEVSVINRVNRERFLQCDHKIALLIYCLQDFSAGCKASPDDFDYRCRHCSKNCYQNQVTRILEEHGIEPFIWMESDYKLLYKKLQRSGKSFGVLGIACLPELAWGIHACAGQGIPVVGIPLDGNRCIRWWGEFYQNSVNLEELEKLVSIS